MAVDLSYLSGKGKIKLDAKTAKCVRSMAGSVTEKRVLETLDGGKGKKDSAGKHIKLPADVYERYFAGVKPADAAGIVEEADRKSTRLNSSHIATSRMPSSA